MNTIEQMPCSIAPPSAKPENLGNPPFLRDGLSPLTPIEQFEQIEHGGTDPEIRTNEQRTPETVFPWGLYKKPESRAALEGPQRVQIVQFVQQPVRAKSAQLAGERAEQEAGPLVLRDGRVMHRFRAAEIPTQASPDTAALLDKVRRVGVVLVADGMELHVVERSKGQLHRHALEVLRDNAGAVIGILRGEHRARVGEMPPECVAVYDPRRGTRDAE